MNPSEFEAECRTESACAFVVAISDMVDYSSTSGTPSITILPEFLNLAEVFSEKAANTLPKHDPQDLFLETSGTPRFGPLYNLSQVELNVLREYITDKLAKRFIQPSFSSAKAAVLFMKKRDYSLPLYVDYRGLNLITQKYHYLLPLISEVLDRVVVQKYIQNWIYAQLILRFESERVVRRKLHFAPDIAIMNTE